VYRGGGAADGDEARDATHAPAAAAATRKLCIAIDDVGAQAGIDAAARQLVAMGRAQALGCMVGGDSFAQVAASLRDMDAAAVDIGLHLDFSERPLPPASPRRLWPLIAAAQLRLLDPRAVRAQIRAQLDAFEDGIGRAPAFVDGHQHVHQLPIVRRELLAELLRREVRPWIRRSGDAGDSLKARLIAALGAPALSRQAARLGFAQNRRLLGIYDFGGGPARYRQRLAQWLQDCRSGDLLMCHPAVQAAAGDRIAGARLAEFEVLAGDAFAAMLRDAGVVLAPMRAAISSWRSG